MTATKSQSRNVNGYVKRRKKYLRLRGNLSVRLVKLESLILGAHRAELEQQEYRGKLKPAQLAEAQSLIGPADLIKCGGHREAIFALQRMYL